jgi:hypothetical protein
MPVKRPNEEQRPVPAGLEEHQGAGAQGRTAGARVPAAPAPTVAPDGLAGTVAVDRTGTPAPQADPSATDALAPDAAAHSADDGHEPGDHPASVLAGR